MPSIKIQRVPGLPKEIYQVDSGTLLSDFLMRNNVSADVRVIYNKSVLTDDDDIDITLMDGDEVMVIKGRIHLISSAKRSPFTVASMTIQKQNMMGTIGS